MFICLLIEQLCTKEENNETGCSFNFEHQCILKYLLFEKILGATHECIFNTHCRPIYVKECVHSHIHVLTHSFNTALAIVWKTRSRISVYSLVLRPWPPLRGGYAKFRPLTPGKGSRRQKRVFEYNSASNYLMMTKLHMGWTWGKSFSMIFKFWYLRGGKGEMLNSRVGGRR